MNVAEQLIRFHLEMKPPARLPKGVTVLFPQQEEVVQNIIRQFYTKFYNDTQPRKILLGINPGRLGAGITGINFTAPRQLTDYGKIAHPLGVSSELSAAFIYSVIENYGGVKKFFKQWLLGAVSPLGYIKGGRNINYYDDKILQQKITPFAVSCIDEQTRICGMPSTCICIGEDKNYRFLSALNDQHQWFDTITTLPHPRFIMQYRRKQLPVYIDQYLHALHA